jgi:type IV pilus assembly protein PilC
MRTALDRARKLVREGQPLSASLKTTGIFPPLATDMIEVGESTRRTSGDADFGVGDVFEDDVNTRPHGGDGVDRAGDLCLFMGGFVAFVLVALYLPIFSLARRCSD